MTMLVSARSSPSVPQSFRTSRASMTWPTISPGSRLRTSRWVPVWQNRQVSVQPTWLDTHSVPRSSSGMWTPSISWPSVRRISHLRVPSADSCARLMSGRLTASRSASPVRNALPRSVIRPKSVAPRR